MTRLTNEMRAKITKNATAKAGFPEKLAAWAAKRQTWAEDCRIKAVGGAKKAAEYAKLNAEYRARYEALPDEMRGYGYPPVWSGRHLLLNLGGASAQPELEEDRICPRARFAIPGDDPLTVRFHELEAEFAQIDSDIDHLRSSVNSLLHSVNTVKQLLDLWPEAVELLPAPAASENRNLPAVQVADLNKLVGLPSHD